MGLGYIHRARPRTTPRVTSRLIRTRAAKRKFIAGPLSTVTVDGDVIAILSVDGFTGTRVAGGSAPGLPIAPVRWRGGIR